MYSRLKRNYEELIQDYCYRIKAEFVQLEPYLVAFKTAVTHIFSVYVWHVFFGWKNLMGSMLKCLLRSWFLAAESSKHVDRGEKLRIEHFNYVVV